ncbi:MAG: hypothetical protein WDN76_05530 [Alphaproteobacteria bacterium]
MLFGVAFFVLRRRTLVATTIGLLCLAPLFRIALSIILASRMTAEPAAYAIYAFSPGHFDAFAMGALLALKPDVSGTLRSKGFLLGAGLAAMFLYAGIYCVINIVDGARGLDVVRNVVSGILYGQGREIFLYSAVDVAFGRRFCPWRPQTNAARSFSTRRSSRTLVASPMAVMSIMR